ncbi:hypothetical protein TNCV_2369661 [Trichonephila clavipes]|nr:hypothetical protein TNCV_2369661 [Trichonephila clavipes]
MKACQSSFSEELLYELGSKCWCDGMQKIPVVTLTKLRMFTTNRFHEMTSSRSVYLQRFVVAAVAEWYRYRSWLALSRVRAQYH